MTRTTASTTAATPTLAPRFGLRSLYLIRIIFSVIWVALVLTTSSSLVSADKPSIFPAILLVVYPLWDAVATFIERRTTGATRVGTVNMVLGLAAAIGMIIAVLNTIGAALLVFGVWALISGAIQLIVAIRRRHTVGAQWPMIVSGAISVVAGVAFAAMSASATSGLSSIAGYSAFGAFWFLLSVIALTVRGRRAAH
jgi:uncharacterized membrane protein HdeD (DUF308 family)